MGKPIIYLHEQLKPKQVEQIKAVSGEYVIIDSSTQNAVIDEKDIVIMLGWNRSLGERLLENPDSRLRWVQTVSAGVDSLNLQKLSEKNILLSNASGIHTISIAEHVLGVLLSEYRGLRQAILSQSEKAWRDPTVPYRQLSGQSMLIVGTGQIGQQLATFAQGLKIKTYGINSSGHPSTGFLECYSQKNMSRIIKDMDIVINVLPLTNETYHLYNEDMFNAMKKGTVFINVGRGASVKTEDLIQALQNGQVGFAALDVFREEPLPQDHPLWTTDNVLITPHISGITPNFKQKLTDIFLTNLVSFINSEKLAKNQVDLKRGY